MCSLLHYLSVALLLLPLSTSQNSITTTIDFHVGVILDLDSPASPVGRIGMSCLSMAHSDFYSLHPDYKTRLLLHVRDSNDSVVDAAAAGTYVLVLSTQLQIYRIPLPYRYMINFRP